MKSVRVISYNIHKGMSPLNQVVKLGDMGHALAGVSPDVLCLQEVSGQNLRRATSFQEYPDESQHTWFEKCLQFNGTYGQNAQYGHGHHGNATLSKYPITHKQNVDITVNRLEQRGILHCEVHPTDWERPLVILNTHLNLLHKDRVKQYRVMIDYITKEIDQDAPLLLMGDFNDWNKKSTEILADLGLREVFEVLHGQSFATFPAKLPMMSLDRIYVKNLQVIEAKVYRDKPWSDLSDHLPLGVVIDEM